jgi:uncharacterized membrane protein SpoIIM required for sporulation
MVFERLIPPRLAEKKPLNMLPTSFLFSTVAIFLALWIFPSNAAIVAVFLTTLACTPLMLGVITLEKRKEEKDTDYIKKIINALSLKEHSTPFKELTQQDRLIYFYIFMFLGLALSFTIWFVALPKNTVYDLFYIQLNTIRELNLQLTGQAVYTSYFGKIFFNNIRVLAFSILFSFIYGAGAIFILSWNASVIGIAIGDTIRNALARYTSNISFLAYSSVVGLSIVRYMLHGVPEILAYFVGGLAGGLISIAILSQDSDSVEFKNTLNHVIGLITLAILLLFIAGIIEVSISPLVKII